ncbi:DNA-binding cell division cycle control protein [Phaffia rhodozyma]|uniref:DNA-binding cell division cycle control protein n=1 Tax=Phaffia rhodozyma TaxID=264483 RepID=A0A0F7SFS3_PHARH|nr:DNA-binding cell division cycle control protein [Phaffia rhodozyma]
MEYPSLFPRTSEPAAADVDVVVDRLACLVVSHMALSPASPTSLLLSSILHSILAFQSRYILHSTPANHLGRYLYAECLLASGAPHSAWNLVREEAELGEVELAEVGAKACEQIGRFRDGSWLLEVASERRQAREAEGTRPTPLKPPVITPSDALTKAARLCLKASLSSKGNEPDQAGHAYLTALKLDPFCWEAFHGLCRLGYVFPEVDVFPPLHQLPTSRSQSSVPASANVPAPLQPGSPLAGTSRAIPTTTSLPLYPPNAVNQLSAQSSNSDSNLAATPDWGYQTVNGNGYTGGLFKKQLFPSQAGEGNRVGIGFFTPEAAGPAVRASRPLVASWLIGGSQGVQSPDSSISSFHQHTHRAHHQLNPLGQTHGYHSSSLAQTPVMAVPSSHPSLLPTAGPSIPSWLSTASSAVTPPLNGDGFPQIGTTGCESENVVGTGKLPMKRPRGGRGMILEPTAEDSPTEQAGIKSRSRTNSIESINQAGLARRSSRLSQVPGSALVADRKPKNLPKRRQRSNPMSPTASDSSMTDQPHSPQPHSSRSPLPPSLPDVLSEPSSVELLKADNYILQIMRLFGLADMYMSAYKCKDALEMLDALPDEVSYLNSDVRAMVGRCYFEQVEYVKAKRAFVECRKLDPYRLRDMDLFSTLLWHLNDETMLSFLSQELTSINPTAPEAWIVTGNAFSLQKEHDEAMRCFRRASNLDPRCAYAYSLSGHEAISMEEFDRGIAFFQMSLRIDRRHFQAWYGLGTAYTCKNKLRQAEYHFRRAVEISPSNAVLLVCVGQVLEKRGEKEEALKVFERAFEIAPDSPMVGFRRAKAMVGLGHIMPALAALKTLVIKTPNEFNIHFLLGKLFKQINDHANSMKSFAYALDLDPKMSSAIKAAQASGRDEEEEEGGDDVGRDV